MKQLTKKQRADIYLKAFNEMEYPRFLCIYLQEFYNTGWGATVALPEFALFKPTSEEREGAAHWWKGDKNYMLLVRQTCLLLCYEMCQP